jgi:predicted TIM-barrel fold metal-dependent hydrolase
MTLPLPALDDVDSTRVPDGFPTVVDAHVHLFPDRVFDAVWRWFDTHGWPIRHKLHSEEVLAFLRQRGVSHVVALHYAHKPGMARMMNEYMADVARRHPFVTGTATVFPGEEGAAEILKEGFAAGLRGVKMHCHVQSFAPDSDVMQPIYQVCSDAGLPLVLHAGREPKSPAYKLDPYEICAAHRVESVLRNHPRLKLCIPHLGADEFDAYERLLEHHDGLWLDTTMVAADYFSIPNPSRLIAARVDRILYGTDFPNLPYAWDRELKQLAKLGLNDDGRQRLFGGNAAVLFGLTPA